mmetsp:Transcript_84379/g.239203  ORF Transcript_84379/g.239203 Transcript_84379/m.239203 type:complete len:533 (-) Transcript_84379:83-1681(-)
MPPQSARAEGDGLEHAAWVRAVRVPRLWRRVWVRRPRGPVLVWLPGCLLLALAAWARAHAFSCPVPRAQARGARVAGPLTLRHRLPSKRGVARHRRSQLVDERAVVKDRTTMGDAVAIIAGTSIGGGFLALPSITAPMGFQPTVVGLCLSWVFMMLTGVAYAQATMMAMEARSAKKRQNGSLDSSENSSDEDISVVTVTRSSLGNSVALVCSLAFVTQILVVLTAQVVKSGEIIASMTGLPYVVNCLATSVLIGSFTFCGRTRLVERGNTLMAVAMVGGFLALVAGTVASTLGTSASGSVVSRLAFADWTHLSPTVKPASQWALPIFLNLICFGQSIPLVAGRLGTARPRQVTLSIVIGSTIPFLLCVLWALVSTALHNPACKLAGYADPVLRMLAGNWSVAVPVACIAAGAIGTTLIASYLSLGQFATDAICTICGKCSRNQRVLAKVVATMVPALMACGGPQLYLPLLAFSGAYPSTLLYGLMPPMAALVLGRTHKRLRLLPYGRPLLLCLAAAAAGLLAVSTALALGLL